MIGLGSFKGTIEGSEVFSTDAAWLYACPNGNSAAQ